MQKYRLLSEECLLVPSQKLRVHDAFIILQNKVTKTLYY